MSSQGNPEKRNERRYSNETHKTGIIKKQTIGFRHIPVKIAENIAI